MYVEVWGEYLSTWNSFCGDIFVLIRARCGARRSPSAAGSVDLRENYAWDCPSMNRTICKV